MRARIRWGAALGALGLVVSVAAAAGGASPAGAAGNVEVIAPAVTSSAAGRIDLFTRTDAGTLGYAYLPTGGSWTVTRDLGGTIASQPAAVSWAPGRMDVFARSSRNTLLHRYFSAARWSGWEDLGGSLRSAPAAATWGTGTLTVVSRGGDNALWWLSFNRGTGWSSWQRIGGATLNSPALASWGSGRLDLFIRGTDQSLRHAWYTGRWSGFEGLGGTLTAQPAAASVGSGQLSVVVRATDNSFRIKSYARGVGWSGFVNRAGTFSSGPGAAAVGTDLVVLGRGTSSALYLGRSAQNTWRPWSLVDPLRPARRLATWVDTFDYALDPTSSIAAMKSHGVRTLYFGTGRFTDTGDLHDSVVAGRWLDAAHAAGLAVIGWYVPAYGDLSRDLRRTVAIANFVSPGGQRFDGVGVDIERYASDGEVPLAQFLTLSVQHLKQVRAAVDDLLVAIVPPPYATLVSAEVPHPHWEGFNWAGIGSTADVVVPMALWSNRAGYTAAQVYTWVRAQAEQAASLSARPVAVEGGTGSSTSDPTPVTVDRMTSFVQAVRDGGAIGGSHYDFASTTNAQLWTPLLGLDSL